MAQVRIGQGAPGKEAGFVVRFRRKREARALFCSLGRLGSLRVPPPFAPHSAKVPGTAAPPVFQTALWLSH